MGCYLVYLLTQVARLGTIVSALLVKQEHGKSMEEQPRDLSALGDKQENAGEQPESLSSLEDKPEHGEDSKGDTVSSLEDKPEQGKHTGEQQPV